jgi:hypothetical protein
VGGQVGGWVEVKVAVWIAYSNQKAKLEIALLQFTIF